MSRSPQRPAEPPSDCRSLLREPLAHQPHVALSIRKARDIEASGDLGMKLDLRQLALGLGQGLVGNDMQRDQLGTEPARHLASQIHYVVSVFGTVEGNQNSLDHRLRPLPPGQPRTAQPVQDSL
jgi:hypothetical protein